MRGIQVLLILTSMLGACRPDPGSERLSSRDAPPAAALLAPGQASSLDEELRRLDAELAAALEEGSLERVLTAEAMTDHLMQASRPFDWLAIDYDVEARLRQLQAMADRVVARLRRGASLGDVTDEVRTIRAAVQDLQGQLQRPGGRDAPPRLDSLLAQDPLRDVQSRAARAATAAAAQPAGATVGQPAADAPAPPPPAAGPRPIGTPIGTPVDSLRLR